MKKHAEPSTPQPPAETGVPPGETSTQALPVQNRPTGKTADIAPALLPDVKPGTTPQPPSPASPRKTRLWLGAGMLVVLLAAGGTAWFLRPQAQPEASQDAAPTEAAPPPPELRPYMDQAKTGDAKAMHMIALMYWNGLNVRQDRVKGLEWYRKAAAAGSAAAAETLKTIEGK